MVLKYIQENKGKSFLVTGIVLMWVVLGILFSQYGYYKTWHLWGVPAQKQFFRDFLLIPGSAESFRQGFEPSIENPYDVGQRIFNYPAFWRLFFYTNITEDDTVWIIVTGLTLFFISVMLFPQKLSTIDAVLTLLVVFSPASMLLYERGNADLFVFVICALIVLATEYSTTLTAGLIVFGAIVKMFPLLGLTVFLKESKQKFWKLSIICVLVMAVYSLLTFQSQDAAWNTTMRGDGASYGSFVLITRLGDYLQDLFPGLLSFGGWQIVFEGLALILIFLAVILAIREPNSLGTSHERNLTAFRLGASIYVGTFLLGNNWDYRLAFLIFVVPQLSQWIFVENKKYRLIAIAVMTVLLLTCWSFVVNFDLPFIPLKDPINRKFIVDEFLNWLLVPGFTYLLVVSCPEWMQDDLRKVFRIRKASPVKG